MGFFGYYEWAYGSANLIGVLTLSGIVCREMKAADRKKRQLF